MKPNFNGRLFPLAFLLALCGSFLCPAKSVADSGSLTVAVASNMRFAFSDLEVSFEATSGFSLEPVFSSSGIITAQIANGAPYDVFLSANLEYPESLHRDGFVKTKPIAFAYGSLVLWGKNGLKENGVSVLVGKGIARIAIADPKLAPYGVAAVTFLKRQRLWDAVEPKIIYGNSVSQLNGYISSGAADAALTAKSAVIEGNLAGKGEWIDLDPASYDPIPQGVVVIKPSKAADAFMKFLFSKEAQDIFRKYGYKTP